jgi:hypothetical protein
MQWSYSCLTPAEERRNLLPMRPTTFPLIISAELESYIRALLEIALPDPNDRKKQKILIYCHDPNAYPGTRPDGTPLDVLLPSIQDVSCEEGNLRYLVIDEVNQWSGFNPVVDQVIQVLWMLAKWFNWKGQNGSARLDQDDAVLHVLHQVAEQYRLLKAAGKHSLDGME